MLGEGRQSVIYYLQIDRSINHMRTVISYCEDEKKRRELIPGWVETTDAEAQS